MEAVKAFNEELSGIYETKPPISRAKMTLLTKKAIKGIKFYKHIVQSVEKFIQKCRPEYKVPGLYVVDSVVRQSRHQFGPEKDVFMPRLCKNILTTFQHIYKCPSEDKPRVLRVLNLWQKNNVFPQDIVQQLMVMGGAPTPGDAPATSQAAAPSTPATAQASQDLTNILANLLTNPDAKKIQSLAGLLSTSQQNQLQDLLKQVKGNDPVDVEIEEEIVEEIMEIEPNHIESHSIQENAYPAQTSRQVPFLHTQNPAMQHPPQQQPAFNRAVLDYDYSDDEQTPPSNANPQQPHSIDPALLAKLPTADQLHKITVGNGVLAPHIEAEVDRRRKLEQEQDDFNKQIQEMASKDRRDTNRSSRDRRRRSRSRSRDRRSHRRRSHSRDRSHRSRRSRSRDRSRRSRRSRSRERRGENDNGMPPIKSGCVSVCTTTLWIGNIASKVMQHELQGMVEEHAEVESIMMIPPRGCAFIIVKQRPDAHKALHKMRHARLGGKTLKCDWAPSKEMPEEQKSTWVKEHGVNYVPYSSDPNQLKQLTLWGFIDPESVPEDKRAELINTQEPPPSQAEVPEPSLVAIPPQIAAAIPGQMPQQPPFGVMPNIAISRAQMPMLVRPGFAQMSGVSPFAGMPQRMPGFASANPRPTAVPEAKPEAKEGETTPTRDEVVEEQTHQAAAMQQFRPAFNPMMQRFAGPMPVQLRMMPGMTQAQLMQPRMGVIPMGMRIPMHIRPGFHPAMGGRMAGPAMMANPMQQVRPGNPLQQVRPGMPQLQTPPGFHPAQLRLQAQVTQPDLRSLGPNVPRLVNPIPAEVTQPSQADERPVETQPPQQSARERSRSAEKETPREESREDFPPRDFGRTREFDRPADRPPFDGPAGRPPPDFERQRSGGGFDNGRAGGDFDRERRFERDRSYDRDRERPPRDFGRDRGFGRDRDGGRDGRGHSRDGRGGDRFRDFGRDQRDRGGRDMDRDRRRDFDRHDRDRGPPTRFDRGRRGDRGFGRGRGGWGRDRGGFGRDNWRRSPEADAEEEDYRRRRQDTMRKRHDQGESFGTENVDRSSYGSPSDIGADAPADDKKPEADQEKVGESKRGEWKDENRSEPDDHMRDRGLRPPGGPDAPPDSSSRVPTDKDVRQHSPGTPTEDEGAKGSSDVTGSAPSFGQEQPVSPRLDDPTGDDFQAPDTRNYNAEVQDEGLPVDASESFQKADVADDKQSESQTTEGPDVSNTMNVIGGISVEDY